VEAPLDEPLVDESTPDPPSFEVLPEEPLLEEPPLDDPPLEVPPDDDPPLDEVPLDEPEPLDEAPLDEPEPLDEAPLDEPEPLELPASVPAGLPPHPSLPPMASAKSPRATQRKVRLQRRRLILLVSPSTEPRAGQRQWNGLSDDHAVGGRHGCLEKYWLWVRQAPIRVP
jgi:hypothetical protein